MPRPIYLFWLALFQVQGCADLDLSEIGFDETAQSLGEVFADLDEAASSARNLYKPASCFPSSSLSACQSGVRSHTVNKCQIGSLTWNGTVALSYSQSDCSLDQTSESVTRTVSNLTVTGRKNATITVNTDETKTYEGTTLGGGQRLTTTTAGYTFEILGVTRSGRNNSGRDLFEISRLTPEPLVVQGSSRVDRTINSGSIRTYHNLSRFSVTLSPNNITWESTCTCPTSGKMSGQISGSKTGTLVIEFIACGKAKVTKDTADLEVNLDRCESIL